MEGGSLEVKAGRLFRPLLFVLSLIPALAGTGLAETGLAETGPEQAARDLTLALEVVARAQSYHFAYALTSPPMAPSPVSGEGVADLKCRCLALHRAERRGSSV